MSEVPVNTPLISQRKLAKILGVSAMAVSDAVKHGRLRLCVKPDEYGIPKIADVELAKKEWAENGNYSRHPEMAPVRVTAAPATPDGVDPPELESGSMLDAATRDKHWKAKLSELKYHEAVGKLVQASDVRREWTETLSQCRTKLLALPSQVRQAIPSLTLDDVVIVEEIVRAALEDLIETVGADGV